MPWLASCTKPSKAARRQRLSTKNLNTFKVSLARPSGDAFLDRMGEIETRTRRRHVLWPCLSLSRHFTEISVAFIAPRVAVWEGPDSTQEPKCRSSDDLRAGGQNGVAGIQFVQRLTDLDAWSSHIRMVQERFPNAALSGFCADFAAALRQVTVQLAVALLVIIKVEP